MTLSIRFPARAAALVFTFAAGSTLAAQSRWIVDASGAGDFTDTPAAFAGSVPGDFLEVRSGSYSGITAPTGRVVVCDANVSIGGLRVAGLPAGQRLVVSGANVGLIELSDCLGEVLLESVDATVLGLSIERCSLVTIHGGSFRGPLNGLQGAVPGATIEDSTALWTGGASVGGAAGSSSLGSFPAAPGLEVRRSVIRLVNARLTGGDGLAPSFFGSPTRGATALFAADSDVRIAGTATTLVGGSYQLPPVSPFGSPVTVASRAVGLSGGGDVQYDPVTGLRSNDFAVGSTSPSIRAEDLGSVAVRSAAPGATLDATLEAVPGAFAGVLLSLPMTPIPLPPLGELWLDLPSTLVVGATVMPASGSFTWQVPVPSFLPRGLALTFQGRVDTGGAVSITLPTVAVIR